MPSQLERVIQASRSYRGVCAVDFLLPDVVDGGPPITRLAARLNEASGQGFSFECIGKRSKCKVFRLCAEPEPAPLPPKLDPERGTVEGSRGGVSAPLASPGLTPSPASLSARLDEAHSRLKADADAQSETVQLSIFEAAA